MIAQEQLLEILKDSQLPWIVRKTKNGEVLAAFDLYVAAASYIEKTDCARYASIYDSVKERWM